MAKRSWFARLFPVTHPAERERWLAEQQQLQERLERQIGYELRLRRDSQ